MYVLFITKNYNIIVIMCVSLLLYEFPRVEDPPKAEMLMAI